MANVRVDRFFASQAGIVTRGQAIAAGLSLRQIQHLLATGAWQLAAPKVYRSSAVAGSEQQRLWVASLWAGPQARLSHASAAVLWRIEGVDHPARELWVDATAHRRTDGVRAHRTPQLNRVASRRIGGLRVTAPERTIIDLAGRLDELALEWATEQLRLRRLLTPMSLARSLDELGTRGRPGAVRLRNLLHSMTGAPAESVLEVAVGRLLRGSGLPAPERQLAVVAGGQRYRLDFAWSWRRVALECDGRRHHSDAATFQRDRERWTHLAANVGYRIVFVTWTDVQRRPEWVIEQVAAALRGVA